MGKFRKNDRVIVIIGGLKGRKGIFHDVVPEKCCRVKLANSDKLVGFFEEELVLDEAEMVKVYGAQFRVMAGLYPKQH